MLATVIILVSGCTAPAPSPEPGLDPSEFSVFADASDITGKFDNIAGGINFWGKKEAKERFMNEVGTDIYRTKIVLYNVQKNPDGTYSFLSGGEEPGLIDSLIEAKSRGAKIMVQFYGVPKWLSSSDDERILTNNVPNYAKYPPTDFDEWENLVYAVVMGLKEKGLDPDYYELFGEVSVQSTWYKPMMACKKNGKLIRSCEPNELGDDMQEVMANFFKIYEYSARGIKRADPNAKIGGVALIPTWADGFIWTRLLLKHIKENNLPLDFYSWHLYKGDEAADDMLNGWVYPANGVTLEQVRKAQESKIRKFTDNQAVVNELVQGLYEYIKDMEEWDQDAVRHPYEFFGHQFRKWVDDEGFEDVPLILTEWNINAFADRRLDTHHGASYIVKSLIGITNSPTVAQTFYALSKAENISYDRGYGKSFFLFAQNPENTPKASFNAFKMFSMLGDSANRIAVESGDDIYSIATVSQSEINLLSTYYVFSREGEQADYDLKKEVSIGIANIPVKEYSYEIYLIDKEHSNSYLGSGPDLEMIESGSGSGDFQKTLDLDVYGSVLVKIIKK